MAQLKFQPIFFLQNFVIFSIKSVKFYAYAIGHLLLAATILSIVSQSELVFRVIIDGSFLQLLLYAMFFAVLLGMASGFVGAAFSVLRTQLLATKVALAYDKQASRKK